MIEDRIATWRAKYLLIYRFRMVILFSGAVLFGGRSHAELTPQACYLQIFLKINSGDGPDETPDSVDKWVEASDALNFLQKLREKFPNFEQKLVTQKIGDLVSQRATLKALAQKEVAPQRTSSSPSFIDERTQEGLKLKEGKDFRRALDEFESLSLSLESWHSEDPKWDRNFIEKRIKFCREEIASLRELAWKQLLE